MDRHSLKRKRSISVLFLEKVKVSRDNFCGEILML